MNQLLAHFCAVAPFWNSLSQEDTTIGVSDTEKFLEYIPGRTFTLGLKAGDPIKPGGITHRTITSGTRQIGYVPKEVFGVPTIAIGLPVFDEGRIVGCISTAITREKQEQLFHAAERLSSSMQHLAATSQQFSASSTEIEQIISQVADQTVLLNNNISGIESIINLLKEVSVRTHLLSINAKIETAHLGEKGKAMGVVAHEMNKLSADTKESSSSIADMLAEITAAVQTINARMHTVRKIASEQLEGIVEIARTTSDLAEHAENLHRLSEFSTTD